MANRIPRMRFALLSSATLLSKVLGFLRSMIIASFLGAQLYLDVFYSVNVLIGLFIIVFADQMELVLSCEATRLAREDPSSLRNFERQAFTSAFCIGALLCLFLVVTLPLTTPLLLPQLTEGTDSIVFWLVLGLLPFALLYIPFRALLALLRGRGCVTFSIISDALQSLLLCSCTYVSLSYAANGNARDSVVKLAIAHGIAFALSTAVTFVYWWRGIRGNPFARFGKSFMRIIAAPLTELSLLNYLLFAFTLIDRRYAGLAQAGGVALMSYASSLSMTVRSIINYEQLHILDFAASDNRQYTLQRAVWHCLMLSIPSGILLVFFAENIVRLVYERGAFTSQMSAGCAAVLQIYGSATALFLVWQIALRMLQVERLVRPVIVSVLILLPIDLLISPLLVPLYGVSGAVLATVIMYVPLVLVAYRTLSTSRNLRLVTARMLIAAAVYAGFCAFLGLLLADPTTSVMGAVLRLAIFTLLASAPIPLLWRKSTLDRLVVVR